MNFLILINKDECTKIRNEYPNAYIVRTCKQKSKRHRYYCPEITSYLRLITDTNLEARGIMRATQRRRPRRR